MGGCRQARPFCRQRAHMDSILARLVLSVLASGNTGDGYLAFQLRHPLKQGCLPTSKHCYVYVKRSVHDTINTHDGSDLNNHGSLPVFDHSSRVQMVCGSNLVFKFLNFMTDS